MNPDEPETVRTEIRTCHNPKCPKVEALVLVEDWEDACPYCGTRYEPDESDEENTLTP